MYPSSSSSSSQKSISHSGLTRYGSAPGSLLTNAVDAVISGSDREFPPAAPSRPPVPSHFFSGDSSDSTCKVNSSDPKDHHTRPALQRSYGLHEPSLAFGGSSSSSASALLRQRSSPAGFLSHLTNATQPENAGFSISRGTGSYNSQGVSNSGHGVSRLKSQLSFTGQESLSQISEVSENVVDGISSDNGHHRTTHSFATTSFGMDTWDNSNSIVFSAPPSKRAKNIDGDILNCLNALETQFSLPQTTLEMATVEKLLHIPEDSVPCKIRAKRGCATHPRSIAERERRTRISGKLKKLQELVPNMDKQTSYADMLDLAVQHIKGLQTQVQNWRIAPVDVNKARRTACIKFKDSDGQESTDFVPSNLIMQL
ncbi:transcription factor bHLH128 [Senna tora]|uniref:Transcription factor bHLH128 n=1 Tax=Senna tora TaxID=362788 RepID=A0A835CFQ2_9FABA|nr:transcription factor bHLH128 [Senna tora]